MLRKYPVIGLSLAVLILLSGLVYFGTGHGLLVRYDPMAASKTEPSLITDVACTYLLGTGFVTVYSLGNTEEATCARIYSAGSLPACPTPPAWPSLCEEDSR
jgi:hypothetical protein